jgi:hypothetical protein
MKTLILLLIALCLSNLPANSAFIIKQNNNAEQECMTQQRVAHYKKIASFLSHKPFGDATRRFAPGRYGNSDPTFGILSLGAGIASLACLIVAALAFSPVFAIAAGVLAIGAVVFGAIGLNRKPNGAAIAGLCIGIGIIVAALIYAALIAVVVGALLGF